jgi:hypothetical protein
MGRLACVEAGCTRDLTVAGLRDAAPSDDEHPTESALPSFGEAGAPIDGSSDAVDEKPVIHDPDDSGFNDANLEAG